MSCLRPHEAPALKSLGKEAKSIAAPPQHFHSITCVAAEHDQLSGEGILRKVCLHQRGQSFEPPAHIRGAGCQLRRLAAGGRRLAAQVDFTRPAV